MKIVLNVEKKHLIFFGLFLVLAGSVFVIAGTDPGRLSNGIAKVGHEFLYANQIKPFNSQGHIEIGRLGEGTILKLWDLKGNWLQIGPQGGEENRINFKVDNADSILFYGENSPYKLKDFIIKSENICSSETNCVSTEHFINKMKELGAEDVNNNQTEEEEVLNAYGDNSNGYNIWNCDVKEDNTKKVIIKNEDFFNNNNIPREVMIIEATGRVSNKNHHIGIWYKLKNNETGSVITGLSPYHNTNNLRYGDDLESYGFSPSIGECNNGDDWCTKTQRVELNNNFITQLGNSDLLVEFIACGVHESRGNQNKIIGAFKKEGLTVTGIY